MLADNNIDKIRIKLKAPLMSRLNTIDFYKKLLEETDKAYNESDIKKQGLAYSVTATPIIKNRPLIIGFNWGADTNWLKNGNKYVPQKKEEYPLNFFALNYNDLGSLKRTIPYFEKYYPQALKGMQSNFCFFRSHKEKDISNKDLNLSKNLFEKLLAFSTPSILITFSSKLRDYFLEQHCLDQISEIIIMRGETELKIIKANYMLNPDKTKSIPFCYLPHPNSPIRKEERKKAWDFCFCEAL